MTDSYVCPFDWCTMNHSDKHDDFDGKGSRFHWGNPVEFEVPAEPDDDTWARESDSFGYKPVCWAPASGPREFRMAFNGGWGAALTPDEVRAYAVWLVEHAAEFEAMTKAAR
jgi:hypothetical protein